MTHSMRNIKVLPLCVICLTVLMICWFLRLQETNISKDEDQEPLSKQSINGDDKVPDMLSGEKPDDNFMSKRIQSNLRESVPDWLDEKAKRVQNPYKSCQDLYPGLDVRNPYSEEYLREIAAHNETYWSQESVPRFFQQEKREPDGYSFKCCPAQVLVTMEMARIPWVKTICEIGFNAGHSAVSWLAADPNIKLYSFDLGYHDYTRPIADYLKDRFPGRFEIVLGDSAKTLPNFIKNNPNVKCDLMSIDGAHIYQFIVKDFYHFRKMANPKNLLHFDDYPDGDHPIKSQETGRLWEEKRDNGQLTEIFKCNFAKDDINKIGMKGFSVGHINVW